MRIQPSVHRLILDLIKQIFAFRIVKLALDPWSVCALSAHLIVVDGWAVSVGRSAKDRIQVHEESSLPACSLIFL